MQPRPGQNRHNGVCSTKWTIDHEKPKPKQNKNKKNKTKTKQKQFGRLTQHINQILYLNCFILKLTHVSANTLLRLKAFLCLNEMFDFFLWSHNIKRMSVENLHSLVKPFIPIWMAYFSNTEFPFKNPRQLRLS